MTDPVFRLTSALLLAVLAAPMGAGCGGDSVRSFRVSRTPTSACSQVGAGAAQCEDADVLATQSVHGEWTLDVLDQYTVLLVDDTGRSFPGVQVASDVGKAYVARSRQQNTDAQSGCVAITDHIVAFTIDDAGGLTGSVTFERFEGDPGLLSGGGQARDCGAAVVRRSTDRVRGQAEDEPISARREAL